MTRWDGQNKVEPLQGFLLFVPFIYTFKNWYFSDFAYGSTVNADSGDIFVAGSTGGSLNGQPYAGKDRFICLSALSLLVDCWYL